MKKLKSYFGRGYFHSSKAPFHKILTKDKKLYSRVLVDLFI